MRTTLTIADDVAAMIEKRRRESDCSLREIINDALRRGLMSDEKVASPRQFVQSTFSVGSCRLANLDDIAEILAIAEGDSFR
jgi:hypothetical protein